MITERTYTRELIAQQIGIILDALRCYDRAAEIDEDQLKGIALIINGEQS